MEEVAAAGVATAAAAAGVAEATAAAVATVAVAVVAAAAVAMAVAEAAHQALAVTAEADTRPSLRARVNLDERRGTQDCLLSSGDAFLFLGVAGARSIPAEGGTFPHSRSRPASARGQRSFILHLATLDLRAGCHNRPSW
jgi:hypothetical protein